MRNIQLSLGYNLKSQEYVFGKAASDSKNILVQREIYPSDERCGERGGRKLYSPVAPGASASIFFYVASLSFSGTSSVTVR